jgi:DNA polymerase elongation subunit (family B)
MPFAYRKIDETPELVGHYKNGKAKYKKKKILQGDRVEDPEYIRKNNLELDYEFYITNQIMNPVKQVLDLELDSAITEKIFLK